jgi:predicted transcriptional regulator
MAQVSLALFQLKNEVERVTGRTYTWEEIAEGVGVHQNTITNHLAGYSKKIGYDMLGDLLDYFRAQGLEIEIGDLFVVDGKEGKTWPAGQAAATALDVV